MSASDPNDPLHSSQSLDEVLNIYSFLYSESELSVCIRNNDREIIFANYSFSKLFESDDIQGSVLLAEFSKIELELSKIELELFYLGSGVALCKDIVILDKTYQIRMEIRLICDSLFSVWQLNPVSLVPVELFSIGRSSKSNPNVEAFFASLSTRALHTFCFSLLGFNAHSISKFIGISEPAVNKRLSRIRTSMIKEYNCLDEFRIECLKQNFYKRILGVVNEFLGVKKL